MDSTGPRLQLDVETVRRRSLVGWRGGTSRETGRRRLGSTRTIEISKGTLTEPPLCGHVCVLIVVRHLIEGIYLLLPAAAASGGAWKERRERSHEEPSAAGIPPAPLPPRLIEPWVPPFS